MVPVSAQAPPGQYAFNRGSALVISALLLFSVLAFAATDAWSLATLQVAIFGLGILWTARMLVFPYRLRGSILMLPLSGTVLWGLIQLSLGKSVYLFVTWTSILTWSAYLVLFTLSLQVLKDAGIRDAFLRGACYFGLALSVFAVTQYFTTTAGAIYWIVPVKSGVSFGPFVNRDHYAAFVELLLPIPLVEALRNRKQSVFYAAVVACLFASVIASASRAGAILVTSEIALLFLMVRPPGVASRRGLAGVGVKIFVCALLFTLVVGWEFLWQRFYDPDPFRYRREILISSLKMIRERPWFGFGLGTFEIAYPAYAIFDAGVLINHAHNDWAQWAAEGGIPFFLLLLSIAARTAGPAIRSRWGLGVLAVFVHSIVDFPMQIPAIAASVIVMLAAISAWNSARQERFSL